MSDTASLLQTVHDRLLAIYHTGTAADGQLSFEPIGIPITADMFKVNTTDASLSPALAVEELAALANTAPHLAAGTFERSMRTLDGAYDLMLGGAMPVSPEAASEVGRIRAEAQQLFGDPLGSLQAGGADYRPVTAIPATWYDPAEAGNWKSYASAAQTGSTQGTQTGPASPPLRWHVLAPGYANVLAQRRELFAGASELPRQPIGIGPHPLRPMPMMMVRVPLAPNPAPAPAAPARGPSTLTMRPIGITTRTITDEPVRPFMRPIAALQTVTALAASATQQEVTSTDVTISFDYCLVLLGRPWLDETFLQSRGWFVPGFRSGDLSSGTDVSGSGVFGVVPTAFIAVRNLSIHGSWTHEDQQAVTTSAALGPFSLFGRSYDAVTGTLACPGMQIVAWVCETQPALPPSSDPSLAGVAVAATA